MSVNIVDKTTGDVSLLAGSTLWADSPIGSILPYGGATAPSGWFICDGTAISRTTYSELFAVIGTSFGVGDGSTTFNLPDLRNKTTFGVGSATGGLANVGDATVGSLPNITGSASAAGRITARNANMPYISGALKFYANDGGEVGLAKGNSNPDWGTAGHFDINASRVSGIYKTTSQVVPASVGVNYIIKAKMVAMPSDFMASVEDAVEDYIVYEDYNVTSATSTQSGWAPLQYYWTSTVSKEGYTPISAQIVCPSTNHGVVWFNDLDSVYLYAALQANPATVNVKIRVTYMKK